MVLNHMRFSLYCVFFWVLVFLLLPACSVAVAIAYSYDAWSHVVQEGGQDGITRDNHYDALGRLLSISYLTAAQKNNRLLTFHYGYDLAGLLRMRVRQEALTQQAIEHYRYDANMNLVDYLCSGTLCPYDAKGRVITKQHYTFDALGNIETVVGNETTTRYFYSDKMPTRLLSYQNTNPLYGNRGPWQYDKSGHVITDDQNNTFTYTPLGQTAKVTAPDGEVTLYYYDGLGRQVREQMGQHAPLSLYYSGTQFLAEQQGAHVISMLYGAGLYGSSDGHRVTRYLTDVAGSVVKRVKQGQVVSTVVYSPYGIETDISNMQPKQALAQHIGFDGQLLDNVSGMQFLGQGYRGYDPRLRRFMAHDFLSPFEKGGINGYVFADSNPIMQADPSGQSAEGFFPHDAFDWGALGANIVGGFLVGSMYAYLPETFLGFPIAPVIGLALDVGLFTGTTYVANHFSFADMATNWQPALINLGTIVAFNGAGWGVRKLSKWVRTTQRWRDFMRSARSRISPIQISEARTPYAALTTEKSDNLRILELRLLSVQDELNSMRNHRPNNISVEFLDYSKDSNRRIVGVIGAWRTHVNNVLGDFPGYRMDFYRKWAEEAMRKEAAKYSFLGLFRWGGPSNEYRDQIQNILDEELNEAEGQIEKQGKKIHAIQQEIRDLFA